MFDMRHLDLQIREVITFDLNYCLCVFFQNHLTFRNFNAYTVKPA